MKVFSYIGMVVFSGSMLCAGDLAGDPLLKILRDAQQVHTELGSNESFNTDNPLDHAEPSSSVGEFDTILSGVTGGSSDLDDSGGGILVDATPRSEVRAELKKEEVVEDLAKHITTSEPVLNEDESNLKNDLDLKIHNKNEEAAKILDKAHLDKDHVATAVA
jgi:hypothetical protein